MIKRSKNITDGTVCAWHGEKLVRASSRTRRIAGIWTEPYSVEMMDENGTINSVCVPGGLVIWGKAYVNGAGSVYMQHAAP